MIIPSLQMNNQIQRGQFPCPAWELQDLNPVFGLSVQCSFYSATLVLDLGTDSHRVRWGHERS